MPPTASQAHDGILATLDRLGATPAARVEPMFQAALAMARIAFGPCDPGLTAEAIEAMLGIMRAKPGKEPVRLFVTATARPREPSNAVRHAPA